MKLIDYTNTDNYYITNDFMIDFEFDSSLVKIKINSKGNIELLDNLYKCDRLYIFECYIFDCSVSIKQIYKTKKGYCIVIDLSDNSYLSATHKKKLIRKIEIKEILK